MPSLDCLEDELAKQIAKRQLLKAELKHVDKSIKELQKAILKKQRILPGFEIRDE